MKASTVSKLNEGRHSDQLNEVRHSEVLALLFASCLVKVNQGLLWPTASQWRIDNHCSWGQLLSTTCIDAAEVAYGQLIIAVDHSQLRKMAPETIDSIDWPLPPPFTGWGYPLSATCTLNCALQLQL